MARIELHEIAPAMSKNPRPHRIMLSNVFRMNGTTAARMPYSALPDVVKPPCSM
jgi:hypothetical protein